MNESKKTAIVTGGASGLGFSMASELIRHGIITIIIGRNEEKLNKAKESLGELCHTYRFDLN